MIRSILRYGDNPQALRARCDPVRTVGRRTRRLIQDLKDTLGASSDGIGLAAPQINVHARVVIVRLGGGATNRTPGLPIALIDPQVREQDDPQFDFDGCLSFPGLYGRTRRPHLLNVTGLNEDGEPFERTFEGFDAVVVHHELDHLDGVLFIDRVEKVEDLYLAVTNDRGERLRVPLRSVPWAEPSP